jgi:hypothetical protein
MKIVTFAAIVFLFFSAALLAHESVSTKTHSSIVKTNDRLSSSNKIEKHDLLIIAGTGRHSLQRDIRLQSGQIRLRLYSPDNQLFSETVFTSATRDNINQTLPLTKGKWRLEIEARNASGKYEIEWKASSQQL